MSTASPQNQELARRLIGFEAARTSSSDAPVDAAVLIIGELRLRLTKLAGVEGFRSLLSRALTLSKAEVPSLNIVRISSDGSLEGFDAIEGSEATGAATQVGIVLVAHLLELLVTFIGAPLTLSLVCDKWPDASMDRTDLRTTEENP
ncbi:MAG: hypothetical protein QOH49_2404 [Acidobacteriota bacterium]|jgi:hypothetical protein|nr:hypothetical protein [Acidobacteriota bacterium]